MTSWAQFYTISMLGGPTAIPGGVGTAVRFSPSRALEPFDAEAERFLGMAARALGALPGDNASQPGRRHAAFGVGFGSVRSALGGRPSEHCASRGSAAQVLGRLRGA
jgi:hypothetical protein